MPFKVCTYDCIYCQLGRTTTKTLERKEYVAVAGVLKELKQTLATGVKPDWISLAGSGEPTLNSGLGELIKGIKALTTIPVAVLTNGSLLWMRDVQDAMLAADLVLPSIDAGDERLFRYVNRPHPDITFAQMVDGIASFRERFKGDMWLEVFLLGGVTGIPSEVQKIAAIVKRIGPARVQLNTVYRPPIEEYAIALSEDQMQAMKDLFEGPVDVISEHPREDVQTPGSAGVGEEDLMAMLGRRPCTYRDVAAGLGIHPTDALKRLKALTAAGRVNTANVEGRNYYIVDAPDSRKSPTH